MFTFHRWLRTAIVNKLSSSLVMGTVNTQRVSLLGYRQNLPATKTPHATNPVQSKLPQGAITSKIKHAIILKTGPARLAQLLQPSFCFSLQPMTAHRPVRSHWLPAKTKCYWGLQQLCKSFRIVLSFIGCFILLVIAPLLRMSWKNSNVRSRRGPGNSECDWRSEVVFHFYSSGVAICRFRHLATY